MPTNRRTTTRKVVTIGTFEIFHLLHACCLCGCRLCFGPQGICPPGVTAWTFRGFARATWEQHRAELLQTWRTRPVGEPQAGFRAAADRGYGAWFPCFAEVVFDGAKWPALDSTWPEEARRAWDFIDTRLKGVRT